MSEHLDRFLWRASGRAVGIFVVACAAIAVTGLAVTAWLDELR